MSSVIWAQRARHSRAQRGMTLVELMVGITVGLFVVAAAATLMSAQLVDNRKLRLETQLQQDLRATMDIISRQIRRSGSQSDSLAQGGMSQAGGGGTLYNTFSDVALVGNSPSDVQFSFYRNAGDLGPYEYKLQGSVIKYIVGGAGLNAIGVLLPSDLTDSNVIQVDTFTVTPNIVSTGVLPCPNLCPGGNTSCWPTFAVRNYTITITAHATNDPTIRRTITSEVRLRNDWVKFANPAGPVCP